VLGAAGAEIGGGGIVGLGRRPERPGALGAALEVALLLERAARAFWPALGIRTGGTPGCLLEIPAGAAGFGAAWAPGTGIFAEFWGCHEGLIKSGGG